MPTGPLGNQIPFMDSEISYFVRYNVGQGLGERLDSTSVRRSAERRIAQQIDDNTRLQDPTVELHPAGWVLGVDLGIGDEQTDSQMHDTILNAIDDAVKNAVDQSATRGEGMDMPEWEINAK